MSSPAVAVRFAFEESEAFQLPSHQAAGFGSFFPRDVKLVRYIDDLLGFSLSLHSSCVASFFDLLSFRAAF